MRLRKTTFCVALFFGMLLLSNSFQDPEWKKDVETMLGEFLTCGGPTPPNTPCNTFAAKALKRVYNVSDFDRQGGGFLTANEIADYLIIHTEQWTFLGLASSQKVLDEAQGFANLKKPVVAVLPNASEHGHIALILPGTVQASGNWKLNCPNSASFFLNKPSKSYVSKHLGFAFAEPAGVKIYGRNF